MNLRLQLEEQEKYIEGVVRLPPALPLTAAILHTATPYHYYIIIGIFCIGAVVRCPRKDRTTPYAKYSYFSLLDCSCLRGVLPHDE